MSEHTPGPWVSNTEHSDLNAGVRVESEHEHGEVNDGWIICKCEGPDSEANGSLLAAAPDLLAACEVALPYLQHYLKLAELDGLIGPPKQAAVDGIKAAIAKAKRVG